MDTHGVERNNNICFLLMPLQHCAFEDMLTQKDVGLQSLWRRLWGWFFKQTMWLYQSVYISYENKQHSVMNDFMFACAHTCVSVCMCILYEDITPTSQFKVFIHTKKIQFERVRCKKISLAVICCKLSFCSKKYDYGAGEMTPWLRTIAALTEVLCLIPITPMMVHNHL